MEGNIHERRQDANRWQVKGGGLQNDKFIT